MEKLIRFDFKEHCLSTTFLDINFKGKGNPALKANEILLKNEVEGLEGICPVSAKYKLTIWKGDIYTWSEIMDNICNVLTKKQGFERI
jgi:hypothetical protein